MRRGRRRVLAMFIVLILIVCWWVFSIINHETYVVIPHPIAPPNTESSISWVQYMGKYFSISYPDESVDKYKEVQQTIGNQNVIESWKVVNTTPYIQIVVQALNQPELPTLAEFPSVALRRSQSSVYKESPITIHGVSGLRFIRKANEEGIGESGAFFLINKHVFTIVMSYRNEQLSEEWFQYMMSTFAFTSI